MFYCFALRFTQTILFLAASAALFTWKYTSGRNDTDERPASVGTIARAAMINCWCVAHFSRGCSTGAQMFACSGLFCTGTWTCKLLRGLADVPFCSAYFLFVMFIGYLSYTASGQTFPRLLPVIGIANGVFYAVVLALAIKCLTADPAHAGAYGRSLFYLIAASYASFSALLLRFNRSLHEMLHDSSFLVPPTLRRLFDRMCLLLGAVFLGQTVHFFAWATPAFEAFFAGPMSCHGICTADFVLNVLLEFLPCLVGFFLLRPSAEVLSPAQSSARTSLNAQARQDPRYSAIAPAAPAPPVPTAPTPTV